MADTLLSVDRVMELESEVEQLLSDNQSLADELVQCQADKDFVWSLWRRMQVANPDMSQAIGMVVQREKEKAELKDRKVLAILQVKDERIDTLQRDIATQSKQVTEMVTKKVELQDEISRLMKVNESLNENMQTLSNKLQIHENQDKDHGVFQQQILLSYSQEKNELQRRLSDLVAELEAVRTEKAEEMAVKINLENHVRGLERDVNEKVTQFSNLMIDLEESKKGIKQLQGDVHRTHAEIEDKNRELENVRRELADLWENHNQLNDHSLQQAELIRQLQFLQQDTQKMMKNQEDAYSMESTSLNQVYVELTARYESSKRTEANLRQDILMLKKNLYEKDDTVAQLQHQLNISQLDSQREATVPNQLINSDDDAAVHVREEAAVLQAQIDTLQDQLCQRDRLFEKLENTAPEKLADETIEYDLNHLSEQNHSTPNGRRYRSIALSPIKYQSPRSRSESKPSPTSRLETSRRTRSTSPVLTAELAPRLLRRKLSLAEHKLVETNKLLELRMHELATVKTAHNKRLERLKSLQASYRLLKEELDTVDNITRSKKKKFVRKCHPRELQKEDSDAVWNELAYYKTENRKLTTDVMRLQEEVDVLRVHTSQEKAKIHEMRIIVEQHAEELDVVIKEKDGEKRDIEKSHKLYLSELRSEFEQKQSSLLQLTSDLRHATRDREVLIEEKRALKHEVAELKQEASRHRMEMMDMKREINRIQPRAAQSEKHVAGVTAMASSNKSSNAHSKSKSGRTKQYQRLLNRSIHAMSSVFHEFDDDGWEEITSETEEEESGQTTNTDTLGNTIAAVAHAQQVSPSSSSTSHSARSYKTRHRRPLNIYGRATSSRHPHTTRTHRRGKPGYRHSSLYPNTDTSSSTLAGSASNHDEHIVVTRDACTSPIPLTITVHSPTRKTSPRKPGAMLKPIPRQRTLSSQTRAMGQRLEALQQQLIVVRDSRASALKTVSDLKETNQQLTSDINLANQRLKMARQNIQKLTISVERVEREKAELERDIAVNTHSSSKHTEQDIKTLESHLKSSQFETCRQSSTIRSLKTDNEAQIDQIRELQDKVNRLERDNGQKRTLLETQKSKLKIIQDAANDDNTVIDDLDGKVKYLTDVNEKFKTQIDSLRKRLTIVSKERREYEERLFQTASDVDRKTKLLSECQAKRSDLEASMVELEQTAQQQLHGLAAQSESAIEDARYRMTSAFARIEQFERFVKTLIHSVLVRVSQARSELYTIQMKQHHRAKKDASLQKAQNLACNILNISQSDMDDIMAVDSEKDKLQTSHQARDKHKDREWRKRCDKLIQGDTEFVLPLMELILEKLDEGREMFVKVYSIPPT